MLRGMRSPLVLVVVLGLAGVARADDSRPRSIWLECKTPPVWPVRGTAPLRLTCRMETPGASGPAFWQTVNPFHAERASELMDPFEAVPRYLDLFETRHARPRPEPQAHRPAPAPERKTPELSDELLSPFEVYPDGGETVNPFDPPADADRSAR
jgi:hypothetical protein